MNGSARDIFHFWLLSQLQNVKSLKVGIKTTVEIISNMVAYDYAKQTLYLNYGFIPWYGSMILN